MPSRARSRAMAGPMLARFVRSGTGGWQHGGVVRVVNGSDGRALRNARMCSPTWWSPGLPDSDNTLALGSRPLVLAVMPPWRAGRHDLGATGAERPPPPDREPGRWDAPALTRACHPAGTAPLGASPGVRGRPRPPSTGRPG